MSGRVQQTTAAWPDPHPPSTTNGPPAFIPLPPSPLRALPGNDHPPGDDDG